MAPQGNARPMGGGRRGNRGPRPKLKNPKQTFFRLFKYIVVKNAPALLCVLCLIVVSTLANVQGTMFTKTLIDDYIQPLIKSPVKDFGPLLGAITKVAGFYAVGVVSTFLYNYIMVGVSQGTLKRFRDEIFEKMERLPISYFDTHSHGNIMSVYTNDVDSLRMMVGQSLPQFASSLLTVVSVFISMLILSVPLTILSLCTVFVVLTSSKKLSGQSGRYFLAQQHNLGAINGFIEEYVNGQKVVKVFNHESECIEKFNELNEELYQSAKNANSFANIMMPINAQLGNVGYVLCALFGGIMALYGWWGFTLGSLASFLTFNKGFMMPINQVSMQMNSIIMAMAGAERIFDLMDEQAEKDNGTITLVNACLAEDGSVTETKERTAHWAWKHESDGVTYTPQAGNVVFSNVDFGYVPEKTVLHDINMFAKPGQKIAFVGSTGAGKTTITNLINRFYEINKGQILYDGIDIKDIKKNDLRRSLGIVLQDTHLFTGTVMENIRYGRPDATDDEVIAAAKLVNAHGFIKRLPDGYETMLKGDGQNLSQGQRQLLAIARAAVADPPVLILDEATSSIDTRTERMVQDGMDHLMADRTTFVIAHRLSTVRNSNCIMVLENGRIVERGNHEELMLQKGRYYRLYTGNLEDND